MEFVKPSVSECAINVATSSGTISNPILMSFLRQCRLAALILDVEILSRLAHAYPSAYMFKASSNRENKKGVQHA